MGACEPRYDTVSLNFTSLLPLVFSCISAAILSSSISIPVIAKGILVSYSQLFVPNSLVGIRVKQQ